MWDERWRAGVMSKWFNRVRVCERPLRNPFVQKTQSGCRLSCGRYLPLKLNYPKPFSSKALPTYFSCCLWSFGSCYLAWVVLISVSTVFIEELRVLLFIWWNYSLCYWLSLSDLFCINCSSRIDQSPKQICASLRRTGLGWSIPICENSWNPIKGNKSFRRNILLREISH